MLWQYGSDDDGGSGGWRAKIIGSLDNEEPRVGSLNKGEPRVGSLDGEEPRVVGLLYALDYTKHMDIYITCNKWHDFISIATVVQLYPS
jgi:hypothetical protein